MSEGLIGGHRAPPGAEPEIAVGLVSDVDQVKLRLLSSFMDADGARWPAGDYLARAADEAVALSGPRTQTAPAFTLRPEDARAGRFCVEATIGIDFHWQQQEQQTFSGGLRLLGDAGGVALVNDVALEDYLRSVICSEMSAASPPALLRAHAVISRSWLLAQLRGVIAPGAPQPAAGERLRWYDREAHDRFDVCADDHCQRYQGLTRIASPEVARAVAETHGLTLIRDGEVCDARFSKCCGGLTEDFRVAWQDHEVPYLTSFFDGQGDGPVAPPTDDGGFRSFIERPPAAYCNCEDPALLSTILPSYDQSTADFFRWRVRLDADQATALLRDKGDIDLGRLIAMEPVERGRSGRLVRLRLRGERGELVVGKELEIRRLLSPSHLYSSAFLIETEGPAARPDAFLLRGAGWGHGVGLCQIGAAVMADQGQEYQAILDHYYPGAALERWYT